MSASPQAAGVARPLVKDSRWCSVMLARGSFGCGSLPFAVAQKGRYCCGWSERERNPRSTSERMRTADIHLVALAIGIFLWISGQFSPFVRMSAFPSAVPNITVTFVRFAAANVLYTSSHISHGWLISLCCTKLTTIKIQMATHAISQMVTRDSVKNLKWDSTQHFAIAQHFAFLDFQFVMK